ncbi:hypothetical protein GJ744_008613 [Endocarpon pusillum]|uniref:Uncharacterized protein n=1 Tax=Endocarpon pusillum TaxID=364733 RepID=A0A8H7AIS0_9EURO|nr:hypothetical protein GJ744_008613 [Endocarpon pusillum]
MRIGTDVQSQPSDLDLFPSSYRSRLCAPSHFCTPMVMMIDQLPYKRACCSSPALRESLNQPHQLHRCVVSFCCITLHFSSGAVTTSWLLVVLVLFNRDKRKLSGASLTRATEVSDFPKFPISPSFPTSVLAAEQAHPIPPLSSFRIINAARDRSYSERWNFNILPH